MTSVRLLLHCLLALSVYRPNQILCQPENGRERHDTDALETVIITGSLKPESKSSSPIAVETYTPKFFLKNPTSSLFEALQQIGGVRPQVNCNVCNTGDIHINGLEGPYTMVLIDGMPLVSGLSSVYGLSGIPTSLIERIEVVKGPASALFGSEAVGGLIHVVTKKVGAAPKLSLEHFTTGQQAMNTDLGFKFSVSSRLNVLTGINHFYFQHRLDQNRDGFTDIALQHRLSVFQKWHYARPFNRTLQWAGRYYTEDRWGGELNWSKADRGTDHRYGESIYTQRYELYGQYQLPVTIPMHLSVSASAHHQNSYYGITPFMAKQRIVFGQLTAHPVIKHTDLLLGVSLRITNYRDNTAVAQSQVPQWLPGAFMQWEKSCRHATRLLLGFRIDHHSVHGNIYTPRIALKHRLKQQTVRWNLGTGFRVVNVFTEDHAALTGARTLVIDPQLKPERSLNGNVQLSRTHRWGKQFILIREATAFYTHFQNRILPNYTLNSNQIYYSNLRGYAYSRGLSGKLEIQHPRCSTSASATWLDIAQVQGQSATRPLLSEKFNATGNITWKIPRCHATMDYTVSVCSPMVLPLLGELDPRPAFSPWWAIHNWQWRWGKTTNREWFVGIKNIFNFTPAKSTPFLIARSEDPFDRSVSFNAQGEALPTDSNPYALTFDPSYVYAPNQPRTLFFGLRIKLDGQ
jgi:outer membrane receptor for ferrienterochelin and colicins